MLSDIEIARNAVVRNVSAIATDLGLKEDDYEQYGKFKAKLSTITAPRRGKLILVTAMTPTRQGDGTAARAGHTPAGAKDTPWPEMRREHSHNPNQTYREPVTA